MLAIAGSAAAQDTAIGSRLKAREDVAVRSGQDSITEGHRYLRCVVNKRTGSAERVINATTEAEFEAADRVLSREVTCTSLVASSIQQTGQRLAMDRDVYRGALAEALLGVAGKHPALEPLPLQREYHSPWAGVSGRNLVVEEMATCVAAIAPAGIEALLATKPGSPEDAAAIRALSPSYSTCLTASAKLTANRASMRAAMAEALYHRLHPITLAATAKN
ncbi:hypothetical protein KX816_11105 [Sphingosinicellaceae bacterium]|nr:hypothetical protein KX816_11105 [Sphingosinicellaceae bacterium]